MSIIFVVAVLIFTTVLCIKEIPKLVKERLIKELATFCILLALGTAMTIMETLDVKIPNPSDFVQWAYSPLSDFMNSLIK